MSPRCRYFGDAYVMKDWRGPKAVNLRMSQEQASRLAEALQKGAAAAPELDLAIYPATGAGKEAGITVTASGS